MSKKFLKIGLGFLVLTGLAGFASAAIPGMTGLTGHVPKVVSQLTSVGRLPGTTNLYLSIGLPLHNQAALSTLLQQVYDPVSPNYQKYLTPTEFTEQYGPTTNEYQAVINFAQTNGFTVTRTHGNRMLVDVVATSSNVERAFHVSLNTYHHPTESRDFRSPDVEPSIDSNLRILSIQGLSDYSIPHPASRKIPATGGVSGNGSGPSGAYIGKDFRNAYIPGTTLNGSGQTVGLLQFDGYLASDIIAYETLAGLTNVPLVNVLLDGFDGSAGPNNDEVCLDIEAAIAMAPALDRVVVFEGYYPNSIISSMAASNTIKQFSASWGYQTDATTDQLYQQLALQGQTFLNASGDGDAWVGGIPTFVDSCENPYITMVGGTTLTMTGAGVSYASEKAWNWGFIGNYNWNPAGYFGSSGGTSVVVPIPSWQQGISMTSNHGSLTQRNVPDVALTGDNVFVISSGGSSGAFGGTSCASPLWAGFMALVNQQAVLNGKPTVGFLAPKVYALSKTANYATAFHDIVVGDNVWSGSSGNYQAVPGYDLCTGLGTPNGTNFINALVGVTAPNAPAPTLSAPRAPWGTSLGVFNGANPNGFWYLFVQDDKQLDTGVINSGWSLNLTSANPVGFASDNQIYSSPDVANVQLNSSWIVSVNVTNYGPSASTNVVVTDTMPIGVGLTYGSSAATKGSIVQFGSTLIWTVGNLATNSGATMSVTFGPSVIGIYTNDVTVSSTTADPNPDDNESFAIANVAVFSPPGFGGITFAGGRPTLTVTNAGGAVNTTIQTTTNLVAPIVWQSLYTTNAAAFSFTDVNATNYPVRFYRAIIGP